MVEPSRSPWRGFVTTPEDAEVMVQMSGRTVFDGDGTGHQMLFTLFESEHPAYTWLNDRICVADGRIDTTTIESRIDVYLCEPEG
jgi:hypothetical protein